MPEPDEPDVIEPDVIEPDVIEPDSELDADSDDDEDEGTGDAVSTAGGDESPQKQGSVGLIACARPVRGRPILLRTRALQLLGLVEHGVFEALGRRRRFGWRSPLLGGSAPHIPASLDRLDAEAAPVTPERRLSRLRTCQGPVALKPRSLR